MRRQPWGSHPQLALLVEEAISRTWAACTHSEGDVAENASRAGAPSDRFDRTASWVGNDTSERTSRQSATSIKQMIQKFRDP